jgi:hypothetical protein
MQAATGASAALVGSPSVSRMLGWSAALSLVAFLFSLSISGGITATLADFPGEFSKQAKQEWASANVSLLPGSADNLYPSNIVAARPGALGCEMFACVVVSKLLPLGLYVCVYQVGFPPLAASAGCPSPPSCGRATSTAPGPTPACPRATWTCFSMRSVRRLMLSIASWARE